jgi:hypothetical protein
MLYICSTWWIAGHHHPCFILLYLEGSSSSSSMLYICSPWRTTNVKHVSILVYFCSTWTTAVDHHPCFTSALPGRQQSIIIHSLYLLHLEDSRPLPSMLYMLYLKGKGLLPKGSHTAGSA